MRYTQCITSSSIQMESSRGLGSCVLRIVQCIMHFRCIAYAPSDTDALSLGRQTVAGWPVTSLPVTRRAVISEQASVQLYAVTSEGELHQYTAPPLSMLKVVKVPPWRFPTRFLHLFRARLVAMCSLALPGWALATGSPVTASGARASRLQSRRIHRLCPLRPLPCEDSAMPSHGELTHAEDLPMIAGLEEHMAETYGHEMVCLASTLQYTPYCAHFTRTRVVHLLCT